MTKQTVTYGAIVIVIIALVLSILMFDSQSVFTEQLIYSTTEKIEKEISTYLNPISIEVQKIKSDRKESLFTYQNEEGLNEYFIPLFSKFPKISSIKYFDHDGRQYIIYKEKSTFVSAFRIEKTFNNEVVWKRWKDAKTQVSEWKETVERDPIRQNWAKYFKKNVRTDSIFWFNIKGFNGVSDGEINAVTFGRGDSTNREFGLAIGIKTASIISAIPELKLYSNPKLFLLNHNQHIIPFIADAMDSTREYNRAFTRQNIRDSVIIAFLNNWDELGRDSISTFTLNINNTKWWAQVDPINMNLSRLQLGVIVTESDLIFAHLFDTYIIVALLVFALIVVTIVYIRRKKKRSLINSEKLSVEELQHFLSEGESENFELKSSLRWDYREEKVNKKLEEVIVKSISAFNNANGGYLVIGIDDDNNILGLEKDYATLKKHNADYFELHLRNLVSTAFTVRYTARKISISFLTIEGKDICVIKIAKGEYPLFLKTTDKSGKKVEKFYIRSGNSSQEITSLTEINNYIGVRFKNMDL